MRLHVEVDGPPAVEVVRAHGAPHGIHDSRAHRDVYVSQLARFLAAHADGD